MPRILQNLSSTLLKRVFNRRMLIGVLAAAAFGFLTEYAIARLLEGSALSLIVACITVSLTGLGTLLALLPADSERYHPWFTLTAWLQGLLLAAAAFAGIAIAPGHHESARTFVAIWALFAGQSAIIAAVYGLLATLFFPSVRPARQFVLLGLGVMATALFWSRGLIENVAQTSSDAALAGSMADTVVKLSPPVTIAETWHQECDASRRPLRGNETRFDIVHGPLTYNVWLGSFQMVAYPDLWPSSNSGTFNPGLLLAMLAWALPLLIFCGILAGKRQLAGE